VAMPAEVPAQPPAPLASLDPHDTQDGRRRALWGCGNRPAPEPVDRAALTCLRRDGI